MKPQFFVPLMTYPDQTSEVLISNAIDLARNYGATLHAAAIDVTIPPITDPFAPLLIDTGKMVMEAERASRLRGEHLVSVLQNQCAETNLTVESETLSVHQPDATDLAARIARHYDVTLLQSSPQFEALSQAVIFGSGRPVILYPDRPFTGRIDHIAIAWDGSRAAARALGDAALFLAAASKVSIIYVLGEKSIDQDPGKRIFDCLAARDVKTEAYPIRIHEQPIGDALQIKAVEIRADLLIMGGYGHSRMREFILGGATADVLGNPLLPVLMSH